MNDRYTLSVIQFIRDHKKALVKEDKVLLEVIAHSKEITAYQKKILDRLLVCCTITKKDRKKKRDTSVLRSCGVKIIKSK